MSAAAIGGATADITASIRRDWARTRMVAAIEEAGGGHLCNPRRDLSITEDDFKIRVEVFTYKEVILELPLIKGFSS